MPESAQKTYIARRQFFERLAMLCAGSLGSNSLGWPHTTMATQVQARNAVSPATVIPPFLQPGDTIGIVSPAGFISVEEIQDAVTVLKRWGFNVVVGHSVEQSWGSFGGTDSQRTQDLQAMLDDTGIAAILCARGGYGLVRIIDQLSFARFIRHPKWLVGFSDVTVLHSHLNGPFATASIHAKMCSGFHADTTTISAQAKDSMQSIHDALTGQAVSYPIPPNIHHQDGVAVGEIIGGNLRTLETLCGTPSAMNMNNKILLVEDTDEHLYAVDRMFWHLKRTGKLARLAGLLVGGFNIAPDDSDERPFPLGLHQIVLEKVREYGYPVCFDFPVGHQEHNLAVKFGVLHRLIVQNGIASVTQSGGSS